MLIRWIHLHNIRSYVDTRIDFPQGSVLLSGDIGAGKSTILLAIEFGLFGIIKGELSGSSLLRTGTTKGTIELCCEIDGKEIIITRILKQKKSSISQESSHIIINGVKKDVAPVELKATIMKLLGYPHELISKRSMLYRYTVYTPQEDMKRIIFDSSEERIDTLRKAFGIDKYKRIRENAQVIMKRLKDQVKVLEGSLAYTNERKERKESLIEVINEETDVVTALIEKRALHKKDRDEYAKESEILLKKLREFFELQREITKYDSALKTIYSQDVAVANNIAQVERLLDEHPLTKVDISQKDTLEKEVTELMKTLDNLREVRATLREREILLSKNLANSREKLVLLKKKVAGREEMEKKSAQYAKELEKKEPYTQRLEELQQKLLSFETRKARINENIKSADEIKSRLSELDTCPLCLQGVDHTHKKGIVEAKTEAKNVLLAEKNALEKKQAQLMNEQQSVKKTLQSLQDIQQKHNELTREMDNINHAFEEIAVCEKEIAQMEKDLEEIIMQKEKSSDSRIKEKDKELETKKESLAKITNYITALTIRKEKEDQLSRLKHDKEQLQKQITDLESRKKNVDEQAKEFADIEIRAKQSEEKLRLLDRDLKEQDIRIAEKNARILARKEEFERIENELKELAQKQKQLHQKKQYIHWIENSFMNIAVVIEKNYFATIYREFSGLFQEWFDILIEDELITAQLDDTFSPLVQQNGHDIDVINLSGGEKTAIALAYRLALNKVINDLTQEVRTRDIIILDEPTDGFSATQLDKMRDVLERLQMKQVIIVSHEPKIESFVDNVIRIEKQNHESRTV
ncbi:MAG: AAA family ATPase [Candidatus Woesearchaeota archaeon]